MAGRVHLVRHSEAVHNTDHDFSHVVGLIVTSPLRRTIQTTLLAFANVLDERYFDKGSGKGIPGGAELVLDPDLQERSALPCDTGSDPRVLEATFPSLDFSGLGLYSPDAVEDRVRKVRQYLADKIEALKDRNRREIVVFLSGDPEIDLPKAGWRSYSIEQGEEGSVVLVSVEPKDSKLA
ncbi:hypothetical protein V1522DRAFT_460151 [Lipomyces starkeyi]